VSIFVRRLSESQGRMRTNRSTTLFDTSGARLCCVTATSAAELTAGSGENAKPKADCRSRRTMVIMAPCCLLLRQL
jgi:hypothetical protein